MGALASLDQANVPVEPGQSAAVTVTVRNTGTVVDEFAIEVLGDAAAWATAEPPTVSLFPGAEGTSRITFAPPRSPASRAGSVGFGVMVRSREDAAGSTVAEAALDVAPFLQPAAELIPRTSHGSRTGRHDLAIDNRGNTRLEATLEGLDPDRVTRFVVDPPNLAVEPGVAAFAKLAVKPAKTFWRGGAKTRNFQVAVRPDAPGAEPILVDGSYLQEPILPWWFTRALLALLGLIIAAILLWVLFLKPQIASTAADTLNDFGFSAKPGSSAGGGGGPTPAPGGTSAPAPSGQIDATAAPSGELVRIDRRLDRVTDGIQPTSADLFITDLIFSNPTGATGDLTLQREGASGTTPLIVLRLENFRDLDFHFVTPIGIRAGETIRLVANCGPPLVPTSPGDCQPAVLFSGYLESP